MKIVFVSNYFNHHQKPFCEEMYQRLGNDFAFISTSIMREERKKLGYAHGDQPVYVILAYEGPHEQQKALALINNADVVIAGSAPNDMLLERIRAGKLLLRYSERPYKKKPSFLKRLYHIIRIRQRDLWRKNIYMLCASAYTAGDFASIGMYKDRTYKWGYFPKVKVHDVDALMFQKKTNVLMWCGRFVDWKHPDDAIRVARRLKEDGYVFHLNMVGTGVMQDELKQLVDDFDLGDVVHFLGSMPTEQARIHMEEAGIYLFTSDRGEGWGAVLNEAMNSGCAVIASHAIGAVPFLMKHKNNGLIYKSGDMDDLYQKVKFLLDNPQKQNYFGKNAYHTIADLWNAKTAAERLFQLIEGIRNNKKYDFFASGPCSCADIIEEAWSDD